MLCIFLMLRCFLVSSLSFRFPGGLQQISNVMTTKSISQHKYSTSASLCAEKSSSRRLILQSASGLMVGSVMAPPTQAADQADSVPEGTSNFKVMLTVQLDSKETGEIEIEVIPSWAPFAAARFHELVQTGFYNDARFFRVVSNVLCMFRRNLSGNTYYVVWCWLDWCLLIRHWAASWICCPVWHCIRSSPQ